MAPSLDPLEELHYCLDLWGKKGSCTFGGKTECKSCGSPYILYKLCSGIVLHGKMNRLTLKEWKELTKDLQRTEKNT